MAKRLTCTEKWKKPFIKSLPPEYKLFWLFLIDDISHAGVWQVDLDIVELRLGIKISIEKALQLFGEKVIVFDNSTKWLIPDFIKFQYGTELRSGNKIHNSVIKELKKYDLVEKVKGYVTVTEQLPKGSLTLKDKDKDKDILESKLKEKKAEFKKTLEPFLGAYGADMLNDFYRYWSEASPNLLYLKWEKEDTWELKLRLIRWQQNNDRHAR